MIEKPESHSIPFIIGFVKQLPKDAEITLNMIEDYYGDYWLYYTINSVTHKPMKTPIRDAQTAQTFLDILTDHSQ